MRDSDGRPFLRTVNLAVDVKAAGLQDGAGKALVSNVLYTLGSKWVPVPAEQQTFSAASSSAAGNATDVAGGALASAPFTPPAAPEVFTTFLLGSKAYGCEAQPSVVHASVPPSDLRVSGADSLLPQLDAPEYGPCRPMSGSDQSVSSGR